MRVARTVWLLALWTSGRLAAAGEPSPAVQTSAGHASRSGGLVVARHVVPLDGSAPRIDLSADSVELDGTPVETTAPLRTDGDWAAPTLVSRLGALPNSQGRLDAAVDGDVPYRVVKKVLYRANVAGFTKIDFVVKDATGAAPGRLALRVLKAKDGAPPGSDPIIVGSLDPAVIDRDIKKHLAAIQSCYGEELERDPGAGGKVVVNFQIACDGLVDHAGIKSSTLHDPVTEKCLAERFLGIQFPKPRGGGIVTVNYPLLFKTPDWKPRAEPSPPTLGLTSSSVLARNDTPPASCSGSNPAEFHLNVFHDHVQVGGEGILPTHCATPSCSIDDPAIAEALRSAPHEPSAPPFVTLVVDDSTPWTDVVKAMDRCIDAGLVVSLTGSPL